tara:strand:- start:330 stop:860 length:531 start_codon:yes stop_codon:yes gene_type:complete
MISTKNKSYMSPEERKAKVKELNKTHQKYFDENNLTDALYIPKMAYRPPGKDELHVSFFPSELEKEKDVYTEFVSIDYESEDPKRTLYLHRHNEHWRQEYELVESKSGYQRHLIPVSELVVVRDITDNAAKVIEDFANLANPDDKKEPTVKDVLGEINASLQAINKTMYHILNKIS